MAGQRERIIRDPVLSAEMISVSVALTQEARDLCLPLKFIPGWLFGISASRVKPELRKRIIRYQRECYDVLAEAFVAGRLTADPGFDDFLASDTPAAQAHRIAEAIMRMAWQQLVLKAQLSAHTTQLASHKQRLEELASTRGDPGHNITRDQAMQIGQAVKAIAFEIEKRTKKVTTQVAGL